MEIYRLTLVPCLLFIDRYDGVMKYVPLEDDEVKRLEKKLDKRLFGKDRLLEPARRTADKMGYAFEQLFGKVSYVMRVYTKDADGNLKELDDNLYGYLENRRWKLHRNAQGELDEI